MKSLDYDTNGGSLFRVGGGNGFAVKWGELIGPADCPLMQRWAFVTPLGSLRLHHFMRDDYDRTLHDHPWWFLTFVVAGGYDDYSEIEGVKVVDRLRRGSIRFRPARHAHRVVTEGSWTLIVTGRLRREWGFWDKTPLGPIFYKSRDYFGLYGYAACE